MDVSSILLIALTAIILYCFYSPSSVDSQEPPLIKPKIPFIGHILGLIRHGVPYYTKIRAKYPLPAFTLNLLGTKTYVINSASLVSGVQRNSKTISFDPLLTAAAHRLAGITGDGLKLLQETESGGGGVNMKVLHSMHPALLGPGLDQMNRTMITRLQGSIDALRDCADVVLDLHAWCRRAITVASTESVYGSLNPYQSREIEEAFWEYESNLSILLLNMMPQITARKTFHAREKIVASFVRYYEADGQDTASALAYGRWKAQHDTGATTENIARLETAAGIGILSNTVPSTFWMLFDVYSRPELLGALREEILANAVHVDAQTYTVDLAEIRDRCTLLVSCFQEVLRLRSSGAPTRVVRRDVMLSDRYLLKAGSVLQMPAWCVNREGATWGTNADEFDPRRFIQQGEEREQKQRATGFMSFGTSPNICPGRHFASGEILALAAMVFLRYDITPVNGAWKQPQLNPKALAASVTPPGEQFPVFVSPRKEMEGVWVFKVTDGKGKFSLITG